MKCSYCDKDCNIGHNCFDQTTWVFSAHRRVLTPAEQAEYPIDSGTFCNVYCLYRYLWCGYMEEIERKEQESKKNDRKSE